MLCRNNTLSQCVYIGFDLVPEFYQRDMSIRESCHLQSKISRAIFLFHENERLQTEASPSAQDKK